MGLFREAPPKAPLTPVPPMNLAYPGHEPPPVRLLTSVKMDRLWKAITDVLACDIDGAGRRPKSALRDALRAMPELERLAIRNEDPSWADAIS